VSSTDTEGLNLKLREGTFIVRKVRIAEKKAEMLEAMVEEVDGIYEIDHMCEEPTSRKEDPTPEFSTCIEQIVERENMQKAYRRVMRNKGAPGIDKMQVSNLKPYLDKHWARIKQELLSGKYQPQPVRVVYIPKANGGRRQLGIPTVVDRLIQQATHQALSSIFDAEFSEFSYGFRAGKSAQKAIKQAQRHQKEGRRWVVDIDLAKFFDEVNQDRLITRISWKMKDAKVLCLIRRYLKSGVMIDGLYTPRAKGTPQGSPLSPLLSNIVLDELDKELEGRKLKFCRYADDCNIYVRSKKAGDRVMYSIRRFIEVKLRLKVNEKKSVVSRPWKRTFLGYSFTANTNPKIRVPRGTVKRLRMKLERLFCIGRGRKLDRFIREYLTPILRGWISYFKLAEVKRFAQELDEWIRRRLRLIIWRQWKRRWSRFKGLMKAGLTEENAGKTAFNGRGPWWNSGTQHMNYAFRKKYFEKLGLISLLDRLKKLREQ